MNHPDFRLRVAALVLAAALFGPCPLNAGEGAQTSTRLQRALGDRALRGARVAALVVRAEDGRVIFERNPDEPLAPASNVKILTALAALAALGPEHRFVTRIHADREPGPSGDVHVLGVRGGGDPALTSEQWWRVAADLRRRGLRRVRGDIVVDDSAFDGARWNDEWRSRSSRAYFPAVGALSANYGAFAVEVRPGPRATEPVRVTVDPPVPYLAVVNRAKTGAARSAETLRVERQAAGSRESVIVGGVLPRTSPPRTFYRSVADPARYAGAVFRMQLAANGIEVSGKVRPGSVATLPRELVAFEGKPLAQIVRLLMKHSNNNIAETLVKAIGASANGGVGDWAGGLAAIRAQLAGLGVGTAGLVLVDGSGLAPTNRVSPRTLVAALRVARASFRVGPEFVAALPVAGRDGTLKRRASAIAGAVRAKTGLLTGVVALSGYARVPQGGEVVFSVLVNRHRRGNAEAMAAIDAFIAGLVSDP